MQNRPTRIVELFIDDEYDESGIEAISLVSRPAHEENWKAFNSEAEKLEQEYHIVSDDFCSHNPKLKELGEPYSKLINEGYELIKVEKITPAMVRKMNQERFTTSKPNEPSELDNVRFKVRFKYIGPRDEKNRKFCADMLIANRVYRIEDIDQLTDSVANEQFGYYNIFLWRGSFNCRHVWVRLLYKLDEKIRNDANSTKGLIEEQKQGPGLQPDTRTIDTVNNVGNPNSKQWRPGTPRDGNLFMKQK